MRHLRQGSTPAHAPQPMQHSAYPAPPASPQGPFDQWSNDTSGHVPRTTCIAARSSAVRPNRSAARARAPAAPERTRHAHAYGRDMRPSVHHPRCAPPLLLRLSASPLLLLLSSSPLLLPSSSSPSAPPLSPPCFRSVRIASQWPSAAAMCSAVRCSCRISRETLRKAVQSRNKPCKAV
jgi:hypothetical protein